MEIKQEIPVFFAADDNYIPCLAVAVTSLIKNSSLNNNYRIIVLHTGMSEKGRNDIKSLETNNVKIDFEDLNPVVEKFESDLELRLRDYYTTAIYYRMFIPSMFKQYDKAIYLDSDVLLLNDIADLYNMEINNKLLAVCPDSVVKYDSGILKEYVKVNVGVEPQYYFNSGVLLMNLKELRNNNIEEKFKYILTNHNPETIAPDQDYLNLLCYGNVHFLGEEWNKMPDLGEKVPVEKLSLIHYNMFRKPWHYKDVPYQEEFWKYANQTQFYDRLQQELETYTEEQRIKDINKAGLMSTNAKRIMDQGLKFTDVMHDISDFGKVNN